MLAHGCTFEISEKEILIGNVVGLPKDVINALNNNVIFRETRDLIRKGGPSAAPQPTVQTPSQSPRPPALLPAMQRSLLAQV